MSKTDIVFESVMFFLSSSVFQSATLVKKIYIYLTVQVVVSIVPVLSDDLFSFVMQSFIRLSVIKLEPNRD